MAQEPAHSEKLINVPDGGTVPADFPPVVRVPLRHVPEGGMVHMGERVTEWTRAALTAVVNGERVQWDVSLVLAPMNGTMVSTYALVIYMPTLEIGAHWRGTVRMMGDNPDQNMVRQSVLSAVGELKAGRNGIHNPRG